MKKFIDGEKAIQIIQSFALDADAKDPYTRGFNNATNNALSKLSEMVANAEKVVDEDYHNKVLDAEMSKRIEVEKKLYEKHGVTANWVTYTNGDGYEAHKCSRCGISAVSVPVVKETDEYTEDAGVNQVGIKEVLTNRCPYCGAKMIKE